MSTQSLEEKVYSFPTKHKEGFIQSEIDELLKQFYDVHMDKFNDAMTGNTCMIIDNEIITYHCDVLTAIRCGLENRRPIIHFVNIDDTGKYIDNTFGRWIRIFGRVEF